MEARQFQYDQHSIKVELVDLAPSSVFPLPVSPHVFKHIVIAVTSGRLTVINECQTVEANSSQIYIVPKQCILQAFEKENAKFWIALFTDDFLHRAAYLANTHVLNMLSGEFVHLSIDSETFKVIKKLSLLLYKHQNRAHPYHSPVIFLLTFNLLLSCMAELHAYTPRVIKKGLSRREHVTYHFLQLASEHAFEHHDVRYYAEKLYMTQGNLTKSIKAILGTAPKTILDELLMKHAKEYLDRDFETIYNIADKLNFKSSSAFINFFRSHTGLTPNEYRNRKTPQ